MESKKNIAALFRESLEQLDYSPSDKVWEQIELDLDKKKKKRRLIIWFFITSLLTLSLLGGFFYNYQAEKNGTGTTEKPFSDADGKPATGNATVSTESKKSQDATFDDPDINNTTDFDPEKAANQNSVKKPGLNSQTSESLKDKKASDTQSAKAGSKKNRRNYAGWAGSKTAKKKKTDTGNNNSQGSTTRLAEQSGTVENPAKTEVQPADPNTTRALLSEKSTVVDSLIASKTDIKKDRKNLKPKDSLTKDSLAVKEPDQDNKIIVAPYYGLNYGGYFGDFNAISNNRILDQEAEMRDTYGVLVRWMTSTRWGIQTGIGKINNRYFSTIEKPDYPFLNAQNVDTDIPYSELMGIFANETKVKFTYDSSYLEVPLEGYYVIRDKKLGLATSFGISFLFGNKNTIFAESENVPKMKIGKLNTIAPFSGAANAKVYVFYKITPSLQWDLYPTFQYNFMGSTDSSGYTGYFFSVRTGLSYKF